MTAYPDLTLNIDGDGDGGFFQPAVIADEPLEATEMNDEPFGPLALIRPFGRCRAPDGEGRPHQLTHSAGATCNITR